MVKYTPILKLEIRHAYYTNGFCTDLTFSPTKDTQNVIDGHRLLVKYHPAGVEVSAPLDGTDNLLVPIKKDLQFQWLLRTKSPDFFSVTALPPKDSVGQYIISNVKGREGAAYAFYEYGGLINENDQSKEAGPCSLVKPFAVTHELAAGKAEQSVKLDRKPVLDAIESDFVFEKAFKDEAIDLSSLVLTSIDRQTLELSMTPLPQKTSVKITYPVPAKGGKNAFALMDIKLRKAFNEKTDEGVSYTLSLGAKKEHWQYFIVTNKSVALDSNGSWQLKTTNGTSPEVSVKELDENTAPESTHELAGLVWDRLKKRIDPKNEKAFFFYCKDPLPIKEKLSTDLVIQRETGTDVWEDVFTDLPAPTPKDQGLQIIKYPTST